MGKTIEEMLGSLPRCIKMSREDPTAEFDHERYYYYCLCLYKDDGKYELSYFCYSYDKELVSFRGTLREVVTKMWEWLKDAHCILSVSWPSAQEEIDDFLNQYENEND